MKFNTKTTQMDLFKLMFYSQFVRKKGYYLFIFLLSIFSTSNDHAVRELWGEPLGYFLSCAVFLFWYLKYLLIFFIVLIVIFFLSKNLRKNVGEATYTLTEDALVEETSLETVTIKWDSIVKIFKLKNVSYVARIGDHWSVIKPQGDKEAYEVFIQQLMDTSGHKNSATNRGVMKLLIGIGLLVVLLLGSSYLYFQNRLSDESSCNFDVVDEKINEDLQKKAVLFKYGCGDLFLLKTNIAIVDLNTPLPFDEVNVFTAIDGSKKGPWGGVYAEFRWLEDNSLEISYVGDARLLNKTEYFDDVLISYKKIGVLEGE